MGGKAAIALGLLAGVAVGGLLVGGIVALAPGPFGTARPAPTAAPTEPATTVPSPSAPDAPSPSTGPDASPSPSASAPTEPSPPASSVAEAFGIGEPAPALRLPLVGGGIVDIADLRGRPVWVTFVGSDCPRCVDELPLMRGFESRYKANGLQVLLVDVRDDEATSKAFLESLKVSFPTALDATGDASREWGALALPLHFWVDGDGVVRDGAGGGIGPKLMARGVQSVLSEVRVTP